MAKPKATDKVVDIVPIDAYVSEYDTLREEKKKIDARMKVLSEIIKKYAESRGSKDDKGSYYAENATFCFGKQAKKSITFIQDKALAFFKSHNLHDAIKVVETINEDGVEKYISQGQLSYEDLESITETKVTYAIDLKRKEVVSDEVTETALPVAASKKPRLRKG